MKLNLDSLKYIYEYLKNTKQLDKVMEDTDQSEITYGDFLQYVINVIVNNLEYDFGIDFYDYVDMNNFVEERGL